MLTVSIKTKRSSMEYQALAGDILIDGLAGSRPFDGIYEKPLRQKRKSCRYVRDDIQVSVIEKRFLLRRKTIEARLVNICQIGACIGYSKKFSRGQKVQLILTFSEGESYEFSGVIVHRRTDNQEMIYGINFEKLNHQFEEHLLKTGLRLKLNKLSTTE